ncbi:FtsQ-type POTRA domain-containing protein [Salicibibacter cibarius]|uniref:Cell division protein DivIB n=1 Tax=Salicibibacter cibarius TaxID=2743000 RepID=A0A7T7CCA9_9BACI|nr:FtsQ-type POTRA domain-containing protein [Salicibibacter cibarius]QQK76730.1 FtsQ-type POTRA domain-containing protein [Salicibibacter cibarius]
MGDRKVVSANERIPALKEQRKKRANRRLIISLITIFLLIGLVVYLQSPLSDIQTINVEGIVTGEEDEVTAQSGLEQGDNIWAADLRGAEERISENLPHVLEASVSRSFPSTVHIAITEQERIAYMEEDETYIPVFANGEQSPDQGLDQLPGDAPVVYGWNDESRLETLLSEMEKLTDGVVNRISEVHPLDESHEGLRLYMNDGIEVETTVDQFAEYMSGYPSVAEEIDPEDSGVLHMKMRPYFESSSTPDEDEDEDSDEENG